MPSAPLPLLNWLWTSLLPLTLIGNSCAFKCNTCLIGHPCKIQKCPAILTMVGYGTDLVCTSYISKEHNPDGTFSTTVVKDCWAGERFNALIGGGDRCGEVSNKDYVDLLLDYTDVILSSTFPYGPFGNGIKLNASSDQIKEWREEWEIFHGLNVSSGTGRSSPALMSNGTNDKVRLCSCSTELCNAGSEYEFLPPSPDDLSQMNKNNSNSSSKAICLFQTEISPMPLVLLAFAFAGLGYEF